MISPGYRQRLSIWLLLVLVTQLLAGPIPTNKPSNYPDWWFERDIIPRLDPSNTSPAWPDDYPQADDYAVANQGQVKHIATQAYLEMEAKLTNGAGVILASIWALPATSTDDYRAINLGQLKNVTEPFYTRLVDELGYTGQPLAPGQTRPWSGTADDYALANIGQVKNLFSFSLNATVTPEPVDGGPDSDGDGIPDYWELLYGFNPFDPNDGASQVAAYQRRILSLGKAPELANNLELIIYTP